MKLADVRLSWKLLGMAGVILSLAVAISITALTESKRLADATREVTRNWMPSVQTALTLSRATSQLRVMTNRRILVGDDADARRQVDARIGATFEEIASLQRRYETLITSDEERRLYAAYQAQWAEYTKAVKTVMAATDGGSNSHAREVLLGPASESYAALTTAIDKVVEHNERGAQREGERAEAIGGETQVLVAGLSVGAVLVGIVLAVWLSRRIAAPIETMVGVSRRLAAGDFTVSLPPASRDEVGQLTEAMAAMTESLRRVVGEVRQSATAVSSASEQIAAGNLDLSNRTEQQAASLQQTASTLDQLAGNLQTSAEVAQQADALTREASDIAQQGGSAMTEVLNSMSQIADGSRRITDIIGVIDGIAFQTNILALNAAVEAARAGEQGRGFAVVATEVRTLAQRSADAAREIKALISQSVSQVEGGSRAANEAGRVVEKVVTSIQSVRGLVVELSTATQQQASGINQINTAVAQIDNGTQQNAALVEESSAASTSLRDQARALTRSVESFRV